jgi:hypothetical protein
MEGSPDPRSGGELLAATVTDSEAFAVFYRRHGRGVLSFFRRRVPSPGLAFSLTAETFAAGARGDAALAVAARAGARLVVRGRVEHAA